MVKHAKLTKYKIQKMVKHAKLVDGSEVTFGRDLGRCLAPITAPKHMCDTLREGVKNSLFYDLMGWVDSKALLALSHTTIQRYTSHPYLIDT